MRRTTFRFFLLAGGLGYIALVLLTVTAQWLRDHPTPENLNRGIRWFPGNPSLWGEYARYSLIVSGDSEPAKAMESYKRAAALNPLEPRNWDGLASAYLRAGESQKAEAALRAVLVAMPHSPHASWRLANFLVIRGRTEESFPYLRRAATYDPKLRAPVFDLSWKLLADPERIFRDIVPSEGEPRRDYLVFLLERKRLLEALPVWEEVRSIPSPTVLSLGYTFTHLLAVEGMGVEAAQVWQNLVEATGRTRAQPPGELLNNPDFEADLPNAGLDWLLTRGPGYQMALDNFVFQHESRSLRVTFDGSSNPDFAGVSQWIAVEPNRKYRFRGYLKTENITTDSGVFFLITGVSARPGEAFTRTTENRVGTGIWIEEILDFETGPYTRVVYLALRRLQSNKLNNLIQGKVWIDNLSLTQLPD